MLLKRRAHDRGVTPAGAWTSGTRRERNNGSEALDPNQHERRSAHPASARTRDPLALPLLGSYQSRRARAQCRQRPIRYCNWLGLSSARSPGKHPQLALQAPHDKQTLSDEIIAANKDAARETPYG